MNCLVRMVGALAVLSLIFISQQVAAGCDKFYKPLKVANPEYPRRARDRGIEGFVELEYTVTTEGKVDDIRILDASPKGVFDRAAMKAIQDYIFEPCSDQGRIVEIRSIPQRFTFALNKN